MKKTFLGAALLPLPYISAVFRTNRTCTSILTKEKVLIPLL